VGYHVDALRAFVLMKRQRSSAALAAVLKWKDSADARRYIPVFWRNFPDGTEIINNWNLLMGQPGFASRVSEMDLDEVSNALASGRS